MSTYNNKSIPNPDLIEILESADGLIIFDERFNVLYFNQKARQFFKMKFNEDYGEVTEIGQLQTQTFSYVTSRLDRLRESPRKYLKDMDEFKHRGKWLAFSVHTYLTQSKYSTIRMIDSAEIVDADKRVENKKLTKALVLKIATLVALIVMAVGNGITSAKHYFDEKILSESLKANYNAETIHSLTVLLMKSLDSEKHHKREDALATALMHTALGDSMNAQTLFDSMYLESERYNQKIKQLKNTLPDSLQNSPEVKYLGE